jgi:hypothetical protein
LKTLADYIDAAMKRQKIPSMRQLSIALKLHEETVAQYNQGRAWPSDSVMVQLADLAGVDQRKALMDLNAWRTKDPKLKKLYVEMGKAFAVAAMMMGGPGGSVPPASASVVPQVTRQENKTLTDHHYFGTSVYYEKSRGLTGLAFVLRLAIIYWGLARAIARLRRGQDAHSRTLVPSPA